MTIKSFFRFLYFGVFLSLIGATILFSAMGYHLYCPDPIAFGMMYLVMLGVILLCYACKPTGRSLWWLNIRGSLPLGLYLLVCTLGSLDQTVGIIGLTIAWVTLAVTAGLSALEILLRSVVWLLQKELNEGGVFEWVFSIMDKLWLTEINTWIPAIETLELVYRPSKALVADQIIEKGPKSLEQGWFWSWITLFAGAGLWCVGQTWSFLNALLQGNFSTIHIQWWPLIIFTLPAMLVGLALGPGQLVFWYLIAEWNRRHHKIISFRDSIFIVWIRAPGGTPFLSSGLTDKMTEVKMGSAGEPVAEREAPTIWGQIWDGMVLWSGRLPKLLGIQLTTPWENVGMTFYPVTSYGGADRITHVDDAATTMAIHQQIGALSASVTGIRTFHLGGRTGTLIMDPELDDVSIFDDAPDVYAEVARLKELFFKRMTEMSGHNKPELIAKYGTEGRILDLMDPSVEDPDRWHRPTGTKKWKAEI